MVTINLKTIKLSNGETLGYRERAGGEHPLILIHGNMTSSKHWDLVLENLDSRYKVIAPDFRGFGISTYHQPINSLQDFACDLKLFVDCIELPSFSLMAWSTGGGIAMQFAADYPDYVDKLILLASLSTRGYPFFKSDENGQPILTERCVTKEDIASNQVITIPMVQAIESKNKDFLRLIWNSTIYRVNQPEPIKYEEYLDDMLTQRNLVDIYHANNHFNISRVHNGLNEGTGQVDKITAPTLILWGENDLIVTKQMTLEIKEDFGDKAELIYLPGCGHSPLVDNIKLLVETTEQFLK